MKLSILFHYYSGVFLKAFSIAVEILNIATNNGDLISNLKLQKLLYYSQAWYLVNNNAEKLFEDEIQAWKFGPVVPSVYNEFKKFKHYYIDIKKINVSKCEKLTNNQKQFIQDFCTEFLSCSATELVAMTHNEFPWQEAYRKAPNTVISTESMYKYYSNLLNEKKYTSQCV